MNLYDKYHNIIEIRMRSSTYWQMFSSRKIRKNRRREAGAAMKIHHTGRGLVSPNGLMTHPRTSGLDGWIPSGMVSLSV